jgi:hypothetical protein
MSPGERLVAAATSVPDAVDRQGRRLGLRRLTALDKLRLFKAAGPVLAQNPSWLGMAVLACSVTSIDDVPLPAPASESQIEAVVQRLGDDGIAAVGAALSDDAAVSDGNLAKN